LTQNPGSEQLPNPEKSLSEERDREENGFAHLCMRWTTKETLLVALSRCSKLALISFSVPRCRARPLRGPWGRKAMETRSKGSAIMGRQG